MSADRLSICPRCFDGRKKEIEKLEYELKVGYGNLTQEAWSFLSKRVRAFERKQTTSSLDERWEVMLEGEKDPPVFCVSYGCRCDVCEFEFSFQHREIVSVGEVG